MHPEECGNQEEVEKEGLPKKQESNLFQGNLDNKRQLAHLENYRTFSGVGGSL